MSSPNAKIDLSKKGQLMTKNEKLGLLLNYYLEKYNGDSGLAYSAMYGALSVWVREEDLDTMIRYRELDNTAKNN